MVCCGDIDGMRGEFDNLEVRDCGVRVSRNSVQALNRMEYHLTVVVKRSCESLCDLCEIQEKVDEGVNAKS